MKKKLLAAAVMLSLGASIGVVLAQVKPDVLVGQRQAAMKLQAKYLGRIGGMLKGNAPYNADYVAQYATFLENLSRMPWDGFDPSTKGEKSKAKPAVFEDAAKFKAAYEALEDATSKLGEPARAKNEAGVKAAFGGVAKACGNCHDNFREK